MTAMLLVLLLIDSLVHLHFLVQRPAGSHANSSVQPLMCSLVQLLVYPLWHCLDLFHHQVELLGTQGSSYSMSLGTNSGLLTVHATTFPRGCNAVCPSFYKGD